MFIHQAQTSLDNSNLFWHTVSCFVRAGRLDAPKKSCDALSCDADVARGLAAADAVAHHCFPFATLVMLRMKCAWAWNQSAMAVILVSASPELVYVCPELADESFFFGLWAAE